MKTFYIAITETLNRIVEVHAEDDYEATKKKAIAIAEAITAKCVEVVYCPCDDIDVNEIVWRNQKN